MPRVDSNTFVRLQNDPSCVRNICIMAHVDHGKTSLSDSLLASNGIISQRMAGKIRYLDARQDEQVRGITMESSAVSLYFRVLRKQEGLNDPLVNEHLINLIDSPGHIDFSSEVSAASRLCDGAIVLVDVVEGVCSQTVTVLRQCWTEKLRPVLVLNKIDRLVTELQFTPQEAYVHLAKLIEQANSVIGSFFAGERQLNDYSYREQLEQNADAQYVENDDSDIYFDPANNNIIFASAIDGWGFSISQMAKFYEQRLGAKRDNLQKVLWGDFYMDPKTKKIINGKGLKGRTLKPLFVSLILDNIWKIYENVTISKNFEVIEKITKTLGINILPRDISSKDDKQLLRKIMSQWLPVSTAILLTVIEKLPSPLQSQSDRLDTILPNTQDTKMVDPNLLSAMEHCDRNGPASAYVSKILSIPRDELPIQSAGDPVQDEIAKRTKKAREEAMRVARQAKLEEKYSKANINEHEGRNEDEELYQRAKDTVMTPEVDISGDKKLETKGPLEAEFDYEKENGDFRNDDSLPSEFTPSVDPNDPLASMFEYEEEDPFAANEANTLGDKQEVTEDPMEDIFDEKDEVLIAFSRIYSGTLRVGQEIAILGPKYNPSTPDEHIQTTTITSLYLFMGKELIPLESCPSGNIVGIGGLAGKILKNGTLIEKGVCGINLAGVNFQTFPIVRVAVEPQNPMEMNKLVRGLKLLEQSDPCVQTYVEDTGEQILCTAGELHLERCLKDLRERFSSIELTSSEPVIPYRETFLNTFEMNPPKDAQLGRGVEELLQGPYKMKLKVSPLSEKMTRFLLAHQSIIQSFHNMHPSDKDSFLNRLKDVVKEDESLSEILGDNLNKIAAFGPKRVGPNIIISEGELLGNFASSFSPKFEFADSVINGFQLAVNEGPLAREPVQGMCVTVENIVELSPEELNSIEDPQYQKDKLNISGRFITSVRDMLHAGFLDWSPRMMWAVYSCDVQTSVEVLGRVYSVVQQRRGRIESEEMKEGTPFFQIQAILPVVEAFGFGEDIRKKTSGAAQPQLAFAGFECIDLDPFWVPTTDEELEELGDIADKENIARRHMNNVRRRKGLFVDEKLIQNAEKQRTLKKN
ncbi:Cytoplasmic GTPase/eEF2-like protein [Zygosaccharomyces mellis]|uniref:Ribosome assembly protein 1 n=1 Tax=Zygosaccharomyces mellis TaxID=42258 RepID=A0A4C2EAG8_9SACH|nr:Cytoplasmic GTPase/eEF2-like protein [Zygosaccharomyces mellis]